MARRLLKDARPDLKTEWHPTKNADISFEDLSIGSEKQVWWLCKKSHEWQQSANVRSRAKGCPYCSGRRPALDNCLQTLWPEIAKQWHPIKNLNLTPFDVTPGSGKKVWWSCSKGHEWPAAVQSRKYGSGCPYCVGSGRAILPEHMLPVKNPGLRIWASRT
jgi:hypothetical protein